MSFKFAFPFALYSRVDLRADKYYTRVHELTSTSRSTPISDATPSRVTVLSDMLGIQPLDSSPELITDSSDDAPPISPSTLDAPNDTLIPSPPDFPAAPSSPETAPHASNLGGSPSQELSTMSDKAPANRSSTPAPRHEYTSESDTEEELVLMLISSVIPPPPENTTSDLDVSFAKGSPRSSTSAFQTNRVSKAEVEEESFPSRSPTPEKPAKRMRRQGRDRKRTRDISGPEDSSHDHEELKLQNKRQRCSTSPSAL